MFAFGAAKGKVIRGKILLPPEYKMKKKKIYGVWAGEHVLYLSDELEALRAKSGGDVFEPHIDANNCLHVPDSYNGCPVKIKGCISTIQIGFDW